MWVCLLNKCLGFCICGGAKRDCDVCVMCCVMCDVMCVCDVCVMCVCDVMSDVCVCVWLMEV